MLRKIRIRGIKNNFSQFMMIFFMIMISIMAYTGIKAYMNGMVITRDNFYKDTNVYDLAIYKDNFNQDDLNQVKKIKGVKDAERKLELKAKTDSDKMLLLNVIETNNISKLHIVEGSKFSSKDKGIYLDEFYAKKNKIKPGDKVLVKYEKAEANLKVLALINTPNHLYDVRDASEVYPSRKEFGFAYINKLSAEEVFKTNYLIFNTIIIKLDNSADKNIVKESLRKEIRGLATIVELKETLSHITYQGEIDEGKSYIGIFSGLFLFIALISIISTMNRLVKKERRQIGILKAIGFNNKKIIWHYISYAMTISILASLFGIILGYYFIGKVFINLEMQLFEIPKASPILDKSSFTISLFVVLLSTFITYLSVRKILKEPASDALKKEVPIIDESHLLINKLAFFKRLSFPVKWNVRDILRNKLRTIITLFGTAGSVMLIICGFGMQDTMNYFVELQYNKLYQFNNKIIFNQDFDTRKLDSLYAKYGDKTSRSFDIEVISKDNKVYNNNLFITDAGNLIRFIDNKDNVINLKDDGVYLSYKIADKYNYKINDTVSFKLAGSDKYYKARITGFNKDPQNQNLTMTRKYFESLGFSYIPDSLYTKKDVHEKDLTVQNTKNIKSGMNEMLAMMKEMLIILTSIALIMASIIIYNLTILSFSEKEYQFATLKVLGFKDKRIKKIFIKQNIWIAILAIIIGLPLGYHLTNFLFKEAIEEHFDFTAYISLNTYIYASLLIFILSYLISIFILRKIKKIDMVRSLKSE